MDRIYLDWNASAPLRPEAREAMIATLDVAGNPSSVHGEGRAARRLVEDARIRVAAQLGAAPGNVVFTSGGTEANALALSPAARRGDAASLSRLVVSAIEHPSVLAGGRFRSDQIESLPVTGLGVVDLDALDRLMTDGPPALVSVMLANNETGAIQPIRAVARRVHQAGGLLHVDAVQAFGKIDCNVKDLECDLLTVSGHKLGAPKGIGALVFGDHLSPEPVLRGGGQERNRRAGTENTVGIAGFVAAAAAAAETMESEAIRVGKLRARLEAGLRNHHPGVVIFADAVARLPNTCLFSAPGLKAETAVIAFDLAGIAVSSGSACSSGRVQPSHVLAAMGVPQTLGQGALRVSLGWATQDADIDCCLEAWRKLANALPKDSAIAAA